MMLFKRLNKKTSKKTNSKSLHNVLSTHMKERWTTGSEIDNTRGFLKLLISFITPTIELL